MSVSNLIQRKDVRRRRCDRAWMTRLAEHALRLARLDPIFRAGYFGNDLFAENTPEQLEQILALLEHTPFDALLCGAEVLLNPTFGAYSLLVGGADADLLVGGRLIDVKVCAKGTLERSMVRQLVAYFILAERARRDGASIAPITSVEIYFARHAHLWAMPAAHIRAQPGYPALERRFLEIAADVGRRVGAIPAARRGEA